MNSIALSQGVIEKFKPAKIIKDHTKDIVSLDFSDDGELIYIADSQTLNVINFSNALSYRKLYMKMHEIQQICHTHNSEAILVATRKNHLILYWSIHQNKVIKIFKGHSDSITQLLIHPKNDLFMTTSNDNTLRIWDLASNNSQSLYKLNVEAQNMSAYPVAAFDTTGTTFCVAWSQQKKDKQVVRLSLYPIDDCDTGAFKQQNKDYNQVKVMKFSNDGHYIILATSDNSIILLGAIFLEQKYKFTNFLNESSIIQCSFSPDSQFIVTGSENGLIHIWTINGKEVVKLASHVEKVCHVKFSPAHCLLVSAGRNVTLWLPDMR